MLSEIKGERWTRRYQQHGSAGLHRSCASIPSVLKLGKIEFQEIKEAALLQPLFSVLVNFLQCLLTDWI